MTSSDFETIVSDAGGFWIASRLAYLVLIAFFSIAIAKGRARGAGLFLAALLALGWWVSNHDLGRVYGLLVPGDRARNLSWCMSAAAGNSILGTGVVGQTTLEPFWGALVAALSLWSPDRALALFPYLSLLGMLLLALSLHLLFRRFDDPPSSLLGVVVAASAILFATGALDYLGPFRGYWAKMFLLKPNHTLGFVVLPLVIRALVHDSKPRAALGGGLLLGLLSLAFVVHWAFVSFSLLLYLALTYYLRRDRFGAEIGRVGIAVLVSALFVAPGVYIIARYFPHALTLAAGTYPETPMRSDWGDIMPPGVSLLFLVTLEQGLVFYLGLAGVFFWLTERSRASLLSASLWFGAYLLWGLNYALYVTARAREADEFYFFLIFVQAMAAGYGGYRLASLVGRRLFASESARRRALGFTVLLAAPLGFPYFWNPTTMDSHYRVALDPVWPPIVETTDWIRRETNGRDVFLAAGDLMQWVPALSGRYTLPFSDREREPLKRLIETGESGDLRADYIVWDQALETALGTTQAPLVRSGCCRLAFDAHAIRVFRISPAKPE
jgi:hypothetical protein